MTDNQIKEAISQRYVQVIANSLGFKTMELPQDHGVDLHIVEVATLTRNGSVRYLDSGRTLRLQLKATTERRITRGNAEVRYSLEAKTYNDLIDSRNDISPIVLILFVLPDDSNSWIDVNPDDLQIRKNAYWFLPDLADTVTPNSSSVTISIPEAQALSKSTIPDLFQLVYTPPVTP